MTISTVQRHVMTTEENVPVIDDGIGVMMTMIMRRRNALVGKDLLHRNSSISRADAGREAQADHGLVGGMHRAGTPPMRPVLPEATAIDDWWIIKRIHILLLFDPLFSSSPDLLRFSTSSSVLFPTDPFVIKEK